MDSKQKVVIAVLVAVVVLFVVALAVRPGGGEGDASTIGSGLLGSLGGDPAAVPANELTGSCGRQADLIQVTGSCELRVPPSTDRMRLVRLRTNNNIKVTAPAPGDADLEIKKDLKAGEEVSIAVDSDGAEIGLDCRAGFGQTCTLVVLGGDS